LTSLLLLLLLLLLFLLLVLLLLLLLLSSCVPAEWYLWQPCSRLFTRRCWCLHDTTVQDERKGDGRHRVQVRAAVTHNFK
jgi:hypothetical protein